MRKGALIGYKAFSDGAARLASFGVVLLAARFLVPADFGLFSLAWASGWIVAVAGDFGLQIYLAREVARQPERAGNIHRALLRPRLALATVLSAGFFGAAWLTAGPSGAIAFSLVGLSQIFSSLIEFQNHLFRGLSRSDLESGLNLAHRVSALALAGAALWRFESAEALGAALALSSAASLVAAHLLAKRVSRGRDQEGFALRPARVAAEVFPMGAGILLSALYFRIDLFFLEAFHGAVPVALFNAAFRLIDAARLAPAAVLAVIFPDLCRSGSLRLAGLAGGGLFAAAGAFSLLAAWKAEWLLEFLYGRPYASAAPAFHVLLWSLPFLFLNAVLTHQLLGWDLQRGFMGLCAVGLAASLALNAALTPAAAGVGAAWACLGREILLTAGCLVLLSRGAPAPVAPAPEGSRP